MSDKIKVLYTCSGEQFVRYLLISVTVIFSILEMLFYPSYRNMAGCFMANIVCVIHCHYCVKERFWVLNPFPTAVMTSIFIYRWLPLIATFLDGKPISYCLEIPYTTFSVETIMYLIAVCAYLYVINSSSSRLSFSQKLNMKLGLFDCYHPFTLWALGVVGLYAFMSKMLNGSSELGDVGGKFLNGLRYLQYVPLVFVFPGLCGMPESKKNRAFAVMWALILMVIGVASNGRKNMIASFFVLFVLAFLNTLSKNKKVSNVLTIPRIIFMIFVLGVSMSFFQSMSRAQLATRSIRSEVKGRDLLSATMNAYDQEDLQSEEGEIVIRRYSEGWSEGYLDNDFLNRYCNIRISDESLWHAFRCDDNDRRKLISNFFDRILFLLPNPVITFFNLDFNKRLMLGSRGDYLYSISMNKPLFAAFRVISHSGDGLATFGFWYFPLQFIVWVVFFKLHASLSMPIGLYRNGNNVKPVHCILGLAMFFNIFNYTNGNGIVGDCGYIIRGYWQNTLLFVFFAKTIDMSVRALGKK